MQFLTIFTPAKLVNGNMDVEQIARMTKLNRKLTNSGVLLANGALMSRNTGMKIVCKDGKVTAIDGSIAGSTLMPAAGFALMHASNREELLANMEAFMAVAGDGTAEVIQVVEPPQEQ